MNTEMVETYRYLRDHGKPISERDAADYACIRAPQPPSKALVKRVKRAQLGLSPRREGPIREYSQISPETAAKRRQLDFHKRVIQQLGGSLTIAKPADYERKPVEYIASTGPIAHRTDREKLNDDIRRLSKTHIREMGKTVYSDYQPDMFEVLDAFGSFTAYGKEL